MTSHTASIEATSELGDATQPEASPIDTVCAAAVDLARAAAADVAGSEVGDHLSVRAEGERQVTHAFAATLAGYKGWYWAVTVSRAPGFDPTVAEVVLLPGAGALLAAAWVPWSERLQPGDLSPGDLLPTPAQDARLVPGYVLSDDPEVKDTSFELGLGRVRVMSHTGLLETAERWYSGDGGPETPMARQAPAHCATCGFLLLLAGSLSGSFGVCANEVTATDGQVVSVDHGCGAHSEAVADPAEDLGEVYDDDAIDLVMTDPGSQVDQDGGRDAVPAEVARDGDGEAVADMVEQDGDSDGVPTAAEQDDESSAGPTPEFDVTGTAQDNVDESAWGDEFRE